MRYDYSCSACDKVWEEVQFLNDRDLPVAQPCPHCGAADAVKRVMFKSAKISYAGSKSVLSRAGSGWNDVLCGIKKASARNHTIETR